MIKKYEIILMVDALKSLKIYSLLLIKHRQINPLLCHTHYELTDKSFRTNARYVDIMRVSVRPVVDRETGFKQCNFV